MTPFSLSLGWAEPGNTARQTRRQTDRQTPGRHREKHRHSCATISGRLTSPSSLLPASFLSLDDAQWGCIQRLACQRKRWNSVDFRPHHQSAREGERETLWPLLYYIIAWFPLELYFSRLVFFGISASSSFQHTSCGCIHSTTRILESNNHKQITP